MGRGTPRLDLVIPAIINSMPEIAADAQELVRAEAPVYDGSTEFRDRTPGTLRDSLRVGYEVSPSGVKINVYSEGDALVASFVIHGTAPHPIDPRPRATAHGGVGAGFLRFVARDGAVVFTHHVDHPGTAPNDFIGRAMPQIEELVNSRLVPVVAAAMGKGTE
jgi:hypothetical protein